MFLYSGFEKSSERESAANQSLFRWIEEKAEVEWEEKQMEEWAEVSYDRICPTVLESVESIVKKEQCEIIFKLPLKIERRSISGQDPRTEDYYQWR